MGTKKDAAAVVQASGEGRWDCGIRHGGGGRLEDSLSLLCLPALPLELQWQVPDFTRHVPEGWMRLVPFTPPAICIYL